MNIEIVLTLLKKKLTLSLVLSTISIVFAQEKMTINGSVIDKNRNPVPFAAISFEHSENKLFSDAVLTDDKGKFEIQLAPGNYQIKIEAIDFKEFTTKKLITNAEKLEPFVVETESIITFQKTQKIDGVNIVAAAKQPYKIEIDKKIYNVGEDLMAKGGTLQDVLANVPSVNVEADGSVSMRGNANIRFLINGKPSSILGISDDTNALSTIPADQIDRIEVITNPSSKYEASGTAGILNIILKKNKGLGFNGSVESALSYFPQSRINANLSWNLGKISWFVNGGGGFGKNITETTFFNDRYNIDKTFSDTENDSRFENFNFNSGLNYNFTDNTSANVSINLNSNKRYGENYTDLRIEDYVTNTITNARRIALNDGLNNNLQLDGGFEHKFNKKGHLINASASFQDSKNKSYETVDDNSFDGPIIQNITNNNYQKTWIAKTDYELPIGENSKLEAGARYDDNNNFTINDLKSILGGTNDDFFTNDTNYHERISAVYSQFRSKIKNFGYQLGLRNENTNIVIVFSGFDPINEEIISNNRTNKNYSGFFPSAFFSYEISKNSQFSLNYARRINRPRSWQLIPSFRIQNAQNYFRGNADLNPSYVNSFEFAYNYSKGNKLTLNPTLYYQKTTDDINFTVTQDAEGRTVSMPANLGSEDRLGIDFNYNWNTNKWLRLFGNFNIFQYKNESEFRGISTIREGNTFQSRLTAAIKLDANTNIQIQGNYNAGQKVFQNERLPIYFANFGFSKTVINKQGTINFNIQDVFNSQRRRVKTFGDNFFRNMNMQFRPRMFTLSFSYRFKNKFAEEKKQKPNRDSNEFRGDDGGGMM